MEGFCLNLLCLGLLRNDKAIGIARKLALNDTNGKIIMDKIWEKYGSFQSFNLRDYPGGWGNFLKNQVLE